MLSLTPLNLILMALISNTFKIYNFAHCCLFFNFLLDLVFVKLDFGNVCLINLGTRFLIQISNKMLCHQQPQEINLENANGMS